MLYIQRFLCISSLVFFVVFGILGAAQAEGYQVIVHFSNPESSIDRSELSRMFLGTTSIWKHGGKVLPVDLSDGTGISKSFAKNAHGRSKSAVRSYWQTRLFSGRGVPPPEMGSNSEVVAYVARNPGAIRYVRADSPLRGVKRIDVR